MNNKFFRVFTVILTFLGCFLSQPGTVLGAEPGTIKWKYALDALSAFRAVAIGRDNTIYVPEGIKLLGINPNGTLKWVFQGKVDDNLGPPSVGVDGNIYIAEFSNGYRSNDNGIYALSNQGLQLWTFDPTGFASNQGMSSPLAVGLDGTIYIHGYNDVTQQYSLYAINPAGSIKWLSGQVAYAPAISSTGILYSIGSYNNVFGLNPSNGQPAIYSNVSFREQFQQLPSIGPNGDVYVIDFSSLKTFRSDGTLLWSYVHDGNFVTQPGEAVTGTNGVIYFSSYDYFQNIGRVHALNPDGTLNWRYVFETNVLVTGSLAVGNDGVIYVATSKGISAFNPGGSLLWQLGGFRVIGLFDPPIIGPDGTLYIIGEEPDSQNNYYPFLYAINTLSTGPASSSWPMWGANAQHTRVVNSLSPPPPEQEKVAVVLVHGIDGSAGSFSDDGKLYRDGLNGEEVCSSEEYRFDPTCQPKFGRLLAKNAGLIVAKPFDYSDKTGLLAADWTIEQLAGELHKHIECVLAALSDCIHLPPGIDHIDRVDIVAHSMGGLITRAYMAGMAQNCIRNGDNYCQSSTSVTYPEVNGKGIIRKFVTVGTPHYGSPYLNRLREFVIDSTSNQAHQIEVGSELVLHLHDKLADKGMHDSDFLAIAGLRIPNKREKDEDGIVSASSAVLPTELLAEDRILYVPYRHTSSVAIPPLDGTTLVGVDNEQHLTYQLVREFLSDRPVHSLYTPQDGTLKQGLLTLSLINAKTGARVTPGDPEVMLKKGSAITVQKFSKNPEGALVDFVNGSENPYAIQVSAPRGYFQPVMLDNVVITKGRPTIATVALTPAPDLAIVKVDPTCVRPGKTTIDIRVKNQGEVSSPPTQGALASTAFAIPALEPRAAKTIRVTITVGTSAVTAIVDSNNAVSESDETNNQITIMGCSTQ